MVETSFRYVRVESTSRLQMDVTYRTTLVTDVVCNAQKQYNSPLQLAYGERVLFARVVWAVWVL